jgi:ATP-dependent exoDNAse (exonuclease V) beta subunit
MTMHASKGLEFNSVFISGVEEGLIPFVRNGDSEDDQDEEVRLFYVGITRAKRKLMLCHARERRKFGQSAQPARRSFLLDSISMMLTGSKNPKRSVSIPSSLRGNGSSRMSRVKSKTDWGARVAVDLPPPTRKREGTTRDRIEKSRDLIAKVTGSDAPLPLPLRKAKSSGAKTTSTTASSENATGSKPKRASRRRKAE